MTAGLVIFSRLDSQRLPGKALKPFAGRALLGHVIDRAREARAWDAIIVATSARRVDDPIADFVEAEGVDVFRGPADDVLGRALACARTFKLSMMGRICGDSPFIDAGMMDRFLGAHRAEGADITTNLHPRSFPMGLSFEVVTREMLQRLDGLTDDADHREHMTAYAYENPDAFHIHNVVSDIDKSEETPLTVDSLDDLVQANWLACRLAEANRKPDMDAVLELAREWRRLNPVSERARVL